MKKSKKILIIVALILSVTTVTAFAASQYNTPAEAVAGITGQSLEDVLNKRYESGKPYGEIAYEEGKLEEFQEEMLEIRKGDLQEAVERGELTQEEADIMIKRMEEKHNSYEEGSFGRYGNRGFGRGHMRGYGHSGYGPGACHGFGW